MKAINLNQFSKSAWLLSDENKMKITGGKPASTCGTDCTTHEEDDGTWTVCCNDTESD